MGMSMFSFSFVSFSVPFLVFVLLQVGSRQLSAGMAYTWPSESDNEHSSFWRVMHAKELGPTRF